jgi:hypothetical protein
MALVRNTFARPLPARRRGRTDRRPVSVELLEGRELLASLSLVVGTVPPTLDYSAGLVVNNDVSISVTGTGTYTVSDTSEQITLDNALIALGWTLDPTLHTATGPRNGAFGAISVNPADGTDTVNLLSIDVPTTVFEGTSFAPPASLAVKITAAGQATGATIDVAGFPQSIISVLDDAGGLPATVTAPGVIQIGTQPAVTYTAAQTVDVINALDPPITPIPATINAVKGTPFTNTPAGGFTDADPNANLGLYKATIDWGDGTAPSVGTVITNTSGVGFTVLGSHTYAAIGTFPVLVGLTDAPNTVHSTVAGAAVSITDTGSTTSINSFAVVSQSTVNGQGIPISAVEGFPFNGPVGTFTDSDIETTPADYVASIDWGDGTAPTPGTVTGSLGKFTVQGAHTYAAFGTYNVLVTIEAAIPGHPILTTFPTTAIVAPDLVVRNTHDSGRNSLRYVIDAFNALGLSGTIRFAIPGPGPFVIRPLTPMSPVLVPAVVDASTQPGFAGTPIVALDGSALSGANGLVLESRRGGAGVRSMAVGNFRNGVGVVVEGPGHDLVENNYVGTDLTGAAAAPNFQGVLILGASNDTVRGNVISGNTSAGVQILDTINVSDPTVNFGPPGHANGNVIVGNLIGTTAAGTGRLGNQQGVFINDAAANLVSGNVISANRSIGLQVLGDKATGNVVSGNAIGTDRTGTLPLGNTIGAFVYAAPGNSVASNVFRFNTTAGLTTRPLSDGPELQSVAFIGVGTGSQTGTVLTFTTYLDRARAQNPANYQVAVMGAGFTPNPVPVTGVVYNNVYRTVTLTFGRVVPSGSLLRLVVIGRSPGGLTDQVGNPLDGTQAAPARQGGSNFLGFFQRGVQVNPQNPTPRAGIAARFAGARARV